MSNLILKKSLGQNFLIDQNIINKIIKSLNIKNNSVIIEVGPGEGALTKKLIEFSEKVLCFEIDKRMEEYLSKINSSNLNVYYMDFLTVDLKEILSKFNYDNIYVVANIPYYITTAIINKIVSEIKITEMVLMVQKEVGNRIISKPNSREYGSLSVFLQYNFDIEKVTLVSKNSFFPKPNVDSVVLKFKLSNKKRAQNEEKFYKLVKDSFKQKRKTLKNNLKDYNLDKIEKTLKKYDKTLTNRAESLTIEEFIDISDNLAL